MTFSGQFYQRFKILKILPVLCETPSLHPLGYNRCYSISCSNKCERNVLQCLRFLYPSLGNVVTKRYKFKKTKVSSLVLPLKNPRTYQPLDNLFLPLVEEDSDNDEEEELENDKDLKTGHVVSLRADAILKAGLGLSRNKIEANFYESKLRLNGRKLMKKSQKVAVGDEIDLIKGLNAMNKDNVDISRVTLVSAKEDEEGERIKVKMKCFKSLTVENYNTDPWTGD